MDTGMVSKRAIYMAAASAALLAAGLAFLGRFGFLYGMFAGLFGGAAVFLIYRSAGFAGTQSGGQDRALLAAVLTVAAMLFILNASKDIIYHHRFITRAQETGVFANVIWRAGHGLSQLNWMEGTDHRGIHWQPAIYLFALIYRAASYPELLFVLQAAAVYAAVIYLFLFAEKTLGSSLPAFYTALAFAFSPYVTRILQSDFHLAPFYCPLFFAFLYYAGCSMNRAAAACFVAAAMLREEAPVFLGIASLFLYVRRKERFWLMLGAAGLVYGLLAFLWFIPAYNARPLELYQTLGLRNVLEAGITADKLAQLAAVLVSLFALAAVPSAASLLVALPPVAVFTLIHRGSSADGLYLFHIYYSSFVITALFAAVVYNMEKLTDRGMLGHTGAVNLSLALLFMQLGLHCAFYRSAYCAGGILLAAVLPFVMKSAGPAAKAGALAAACAAAFLPGYASFYFGGFYKAHSLPAYATAAVDRAISMLPRDTSVPVITNGNILPHIASRQYVIDFDERPDMAALNPVLAGGCREFYLLGFMKFKKYIAKDPYASVEAITAAAKKEGFTAQAVMDDAGAKVKLLRFVKKNAR